MMLHTYNYIWQECLFKNHEFDLEVQTYAAGTDQGKTDQALAGNKIPSAIKHLGTPKNTMTNSVCMYLFDFKMNFMSNSHP